MRREYHIGVPGHFRWLDADKVDIHPVQRTPARALLLCDLDVPTRAEPALVDPGLGIWSETWTLGALVYVNDHAATGLANRIALLMRLLQSSQNTGMKVPALVASPTAGP